MRATVAGLQSSTAVIRGASRYDRVCGSVHKHSCEDQGLASSGNVTPRRPGNPKESRFFVIGAALPIASFFPPSDLSRICQQILKICIFRGGIHAGTENCSEQICLQPVLNIHNLSLAGYFEQDRLSLWGSGLARGGSQSRFNLRSARLYNLSTSVCVAGKIPQYSPPI